MTDRAAPKAKKPAKDRAAPKAKKPAKDRAAPKAKKPAKDRAAPKAVPKLVDKEIVPGIGHNLPPTGEKNPEAIKLLDELMEFQKQKKTIAKSERDVRNRLKSEFGILASSVAREVALRKLDPDVRVQVETNHEDFKRMVGYQPSLDFVNGVPTYASKKAQPNEEERNTEPMRAKTGKKLFEKDDKFQVADAQNEEQQSSVYDEEDEGGVIEREG